MSRFTVRSLTSDDFAALNRLETEVFGALGEPTLEIGRPMDAAAFASADELAVVARHRIANMLRRDPDAAVRSRVSVSRPDPVLSPAVA